MRRAMVVSAVLAVGLALVGCASTDHTWQDEFTARLEGTSRSIEEALAEVHPHMSFEEDFETFPPLGETVEFKAELLKELGPPDGCEEVQEKGEHAVGGFVSLTYQVPKNLTPQLERRLPSAIQEAIAELEAIEGEAETCGSS
jgi:hypothetical protein